MTALASSKHSCPVCGETIRQPASGRPRRFCSIDCRVRSLHGRTIKSHGRRKAPSERVGVSDSGVGVSLKKSATSSVRCEGENGDLQKVSLYWIEVNPATHKLTDGVMERTPASHGQWAGFNTERGVAWAIEVGKPFGKVAWYARHGDASYGPTDVNTAKQAAMAFAGGAKSFPDSGIASSFSGVVNLHADPDVAAEMRVVTP
jgi:hypothetical protein